MTSLINIRILIFQELVYYYPLEFVIERDLILMFMLSYGFVTYEYFLHGISMNEGSFLLC